MTPEKEEVSACVSYLRQYRIFGCINPDIDKAADLIEALVAERGALKAENEKLKNPNLFWADHDPEESVWCPREYLEENDGYNAVVEFRTARELPNIFAVFIPREEVFEIDGDSIYEQIYREFYTEKEAEDFLALNQKEDK